MNVEPGDKVRVKGKAYRGKRGIVEKVRAQSLIIRLEENDELLQVAPSEVTNFSLAA